MLCCVTKSVRAQFPRMLLLFHFPHCVSASYPSGITNSNKRVTRCGTFLNGLLFKTRRYGTNNAVVSFFGGLPIETTANLHKLELLLQKESKRWTTSKILEYPRLQYGSAQRISGCNYKAFWNDVSLQFARLLNIEEFEKISEWFGLRRKRERDCTKELSGS